MSLPLVAIAGETAKPGTAGTCTSYDADKRVVVVEACGHAADKPDEWDYSSCLRSLREKTVEKLCKRGPGSYKWRFQVGDEKSMLDQSTTCK